MKLTFKLSYNKDGTATLWYSHKGLLTKVTRYTAEQIEIAGEAFHIVQERDAAIFYRGLNCGEKG